MGIMVSRLVDKLAEIGVRFLKFDKKRQQWTELSNTQARHKTGHKFRDTLQLLSKKKTLSQQLNHTCTPTMGGDKDMISILKGLSRSADAFGEQTTPSINLSNENISVVSAESITEESKQQTHADESTRNDLIFSKHGALRLENEYPENQLNFSASSFFDQ